jgi:hypothetical protein
MKLAGMLLVAVLALATLACARNDANRCTAICNKGISFAKQAVDEKVKDLPEEAIGAATAGWLRAQGRLNQNLSSCVERCVREADVGVLACLESAGALAQYLECLRVK